MIKVIKGMIKASGVFYPMNATITGLSEKEEARLAKLGVCEIVAAEVTEKAQKASKPNTAATTATDEIKLNVDDIVVGGK